MVLFPVTVLILVVIVNRYFGGLFAKKVLGRRFDPVTEEYEPSITVVIPMFNEGRGIRATIESLLDQEYPPEKLTITVIDDCSTDDSLVWARRMAAENPDRVLVLKNKQNVGKRVGIAAAVKRATTEMIVSVDSDVIVDRYAIRELVRRFVSDDIAAVGGRVNVSNPNENWLTKMQTIKYHFGYGYLKSFERVFKSVMCLSGCLTAYRRDVLIELEPVLMNRNIFGVPIKYGEDRYLTRQIVKAGYRTTITLAANCWTVAPATLTKYFSQQLRWRRSNFADYLMGLSHVWKVNPFISLHYFSLFALQLLYPIALVHSLLFGSFWPLVSLHLVILIAMGCIYRLETRGLPEAQRVSPFAFTPMVVLMPVTYLVLNALALWTLDSSSWETRSHGGVTALGSMEETEEVELPLAS